MSRKVDRSVVDLQFENKQFEKGIKETMNSLDGLKKNLEMKDADKGLKNVDKTAKGITLATLSNGVDSISVKFSALGIAGVAALTRISNMAITAGTNMVKAFTITPIKTGFQEYETQMNAVQTILANTQSKGSTLKDVNAALDELNHYADMTIYNFTEMTRNIGTFTAAGIELDTSVSAIKGIANLAAVSGSNSQQASTAMYQLSQALASGTVKLQDWNSVVNAGMGGQIFQDSLKETARVHGVNVDKMIKDEGSFRESLHKGWLTSQILTETLAKFTGDLSEEQLINQGYTKAQAEEIIKLGKMANDAATKVKTFSQLWETLNEAAQSGWTKSWEILIGDFEEAKVFLTDLSNLFGGIIDRSSDARNQMLQDWKDLGGRNDAIEGLHNLINAVVNALQALSGGFRSAIPKTTGKDLANITAGFKHFSEVIFDFVDKNESMFNSIGAAIGSIVAVIKEVFGQLGKAFGTVIGLISPAQSGVVGFIESVANLIIKISNWVIQTNAIGKALNLVIKILTPFIQVVKVVITTVARFVQILMDLVPDIQLMGEESETTMNKVEKSFSLFGAITTLIDKFSDAIKNLASKIGPTFEKFVGLIKAGLQTVWTAIKETFSGKDLVDGMNVVNVALMGGFLLGLKKFIGKLGSTLDDLVEKGNILGKIGEIFDGLGETMKSFQASLDAKTLMTIAGAIAILTASIVVLAMIDTKKLAVALGAIAVMMGELMGTLVVFQKISSGGKLKGFTQTATSLVIFSSAILILAFALKKISSIPTTSLIKALGGVAILSGMMIMISKELSKAEKSLNKGVKGMIKFSVALLLMTKVLEKLAAIPFTSLVKALGALGILLAEISLFMKHTKNSITPKDAFALTVLAVALRLMANTLGALSTINSSSLIKALGAMGAMFAMIAIFVRNVGKPEKLVSTSISITILAVALGMMTKSLERLSGINASSLAKALGAMGIMLAGIVIALDKMPDTLMSDAASITILAIALKIMAGVLTSLSVIPFTSLVKALGAMAITLATLVIAMNSIQGSIAGAAGLALLSASMILLATSLKILASIPFKSLIKALGGIGAAFLIFGIAAYALAPVSPVLLVLAGSIALFGVAIGAVGAGIAAFGLGMTMLGSMTAAGIASMTLAFRSIITLIPFMAKSLAEGFIVILEVVATSGAAIVGAVSTILASILEALIINLPLFIELVTTTIISLIDAIILLIPKFVELGASIIIGFMEGVANNIGNIVSLGIQAAVNFINGVAENLGAIIDSAFKLIIAWIDGLANAIRNNHAALRSAIWNLITAIVEAVLSFGGSMIKTGKDIIGNILSGIWGKMKNIGRDLVNVGKDMIRGIGEGISNMGHYLVEKATSVVSGAVDGLLSFLGIKSPSRKGIWIGQHTIGGIIVGVDNMKKKLSRSTVGAGKVAVDGLRSSMDMLSDMVSTDFDNTITITPVLDLDQYKRDMIQLDKLNPDQLKVDNFDPQQLQQFKRRPKRPGNNQDLILERDGGGETTINYNQTINAPRQLSRLDIYRDTNNGLQQVKDVVKEKKKK